MLQLNKLGCIKIDTKRARCIIHDTSLAGLSIGVQNTKRASDTEWRSLEFYSESSSDYCLRYEELQKIAIKYLRLFSSYFLQ